MKIEDMKKIVDDVEYLRGEINGKIFGDINGEVSIERMIAFLEGDNNGNIYVMEHLISIVKLKNGIK
jgi:hypothetical protein